MSGTERIVARIGLSRALKIHTDTQLLCKDTVHTGQQQNKQIAVFPCYNKNCGGRNGHLKMHANPYF